MLSSLVLAHTFMAHVDFEVEENIPGPRVIDISSCQVLWSRAPKMDAPPDLMLDFPRTSIG